MSKKTLVSAITAALVVGAASTTFAAANPFSDVPEPRRDHCGVYPVKGHHLSRGLVLARPHYQDFLAVRPRHLHGIAPRGDQVDVGLRQGVLRLGRQPEPGRDAFFRNLSFF